MKPHAHLTDDLIQALLDGDLSPVERSRAGAHLASCARCRARADAWSALLADLSSLPRLVPLEGFADRVVRELAPSPRPSLAARAAAVVDRLRSGHPQEIHLQDLAGGGLRGLRAARVRRHVESCDACGSQVRRWADLFARLERLERFAPADGFAERVMAATSAARSAQGARARRAARAGEAAARPAGATRWLPVPLRGFVPASRQVWAAVSGVALTPAVTLGLLLYTVFSHPTVTPTALLRFVGWKATEAAGALWAAAAGAAVESPVTFRLYSLVEWLASAPAVAATTAVLLSIGTLAAAWVLVRNLTPVPRPEGRYAHASR